MSCAVCTEDIFIYFFFRKYIQTIPQAQARTHLRTFCKYLCGIKFFLFVYIIMGEKLVSLYYNSKSLSPHALIYAQKSDTTMDSHEQNIRNFLL